MGLRGYSGEDLTVLWINIDMQNGLHPEGETETAKT